MVAKYVNQYTRYLTFIVSIVKVSGFAIDLQRNNLVVRARLEIYWRSYFDVTVGSMFVMWLGEQISLFGLGNGSSMIIFAGIVCHYPEYIIKTLAHVREGLMDPVVAILILIVFVVITACIVILEGGQRKIPVQYARRIVGQRVYGGQSTYIPFKINTAGVMPVILTGSVLNIPMFFSAMLAERFAIFKWWQKL